MSMSSTKAPCTLLACRNTLRTICSSPSLEAIIYCNRKVRASVMALEIPLVTALYCLTLDYAAFGVLGAGRALPIMLGGLLRHSFNVLDSSETFLLLKILQESLFYNGLKIP